MAGEKIVTKLKSQLMKHGVRLQLPVSKLYKLVLKNGAISFYRKRINTWW